MKTVRFIYSSPGGNTELVARTVTDVLSEAGCNVQLERCENVDIETLAGTETLILAAPTYGHGEPDQRFATFLQALEAVDLSGCRCALIGLGDSKYDDDYNMAILPILLRLQKDKGMQKLHFPLAINKSPLPQLESRIIPWAEDLVRILR